MPTSCGRVSAALWGRQSSGHLLGLLTPLLGSKGGVKTRAQPVIFWTMHRVYRTWGAILA